MSHEAPGRIRSAAVGLNWIEASFENGGMVRVEVLAANLARIRFTPNAVWSPQVTGAIAAREWAPVRVLGNDSGINLALVTDAMQIYLQREPFRIDILWPDRQPLLVDAEPGILLDRETGEIITRKQSPAGEHILGMGPRGGPVDRVGRAFAMINTDSNAYGPLTDPLYISVPFYYSFTGGRAAGVFLDSAAQPYLDFGASTAGRTELSVRSGDLDYYVIAGPSPLAVSQTWTQLTGTSPLPPRWALGYHQSRYSYYSEAELLEVASTLRQNNIPADVLWLDIDFMDRFRLFTWNRDKFPDPAAMNAKLAADGFRCININEPCVLTDDPLWSDLSRSRFLLTDRDRATVVNNIWFGDVSWMDFSQRAFRTWYKERLKRFLASGTAGLWNDLNEPAQNFMPDAIHDFNGERRADKYARNLYALNMASATDEAVRELRPNVRPWQISRSGYAGIQRFSANWSGDANSDWESLRTNVQMTVSTGLSGQEFFGHDAGGFLGSPSPELFARWLQFSLHTALFRNHAVNDAERREPWVFPEPWRGIIKSTIEQRYRMLPLLYSLMESATRAVQPFVAPLSFCFPADEATFGRSLEYMLGESLLVAPVVEEGAETREVYLPGRGAWVDVRTGESYTSGKTAVVPAPAESIPVLAREGTILPLGPLIQHTGEIATADLDVAVFPGRDTAFALYEDDGVSTEWTRGDFLRTELRLSHGVDGLTLGKRKVAGGRADAGRTWRLTVHRILAMPRGVTLNDQPLAASDAPGTQGWRYDGDRRVLTAAIQDPGKDWTLRIRP